MQIAILTTIVERRTAKATAYIALKSPMVKLAAVLTLVLLIGCEGGGGGGAY